MPVLSLSYYVTNCFSQSSRTINCKFKRLACKEFSNFTNPEFFYLSQFKFWRTVQFIQQGHILLHVLNATSAGSTSFGCEDTLNAIAL